MAKHSYRGHPLTLRELRLWHWRRAMSSRKAADKYRGQDSRFAMSQTKQNDARADFHIKAVQALNDVVPGTAEYDHKLAESVNA